MTREDARLTSLAARKLARAIHLVEQDAYQRGVIDASSALRDLLAHGGSVVFDATRWDQNLLTLRSADGRLLETPVVLPDAIHRLVRGKR